MRFSAVLPAALLFAVSAGMADAQTAPKTMPADSAGTPATGTPATATTGAGPTSPAGHAAHLSTRPDHGANSFTRAQAARRIESRGFRHVDDLVRDDNGVWHGSATRNGQPVKVWEDFKGRVGVE